MTAQTSPRDRLRRNLQQSAVAGAGAYVAGYLVTLVFVAIDGVSFGGEAGRLTVAGWVFYAAHTVRMRVTGFVGEGTETRSINLFEGFEEFTDLTEAVPEILYLLVPVLALVGAGYLLHQRVGDETDTPAASALLGASVVAGYLPLAIVGRFLASHTESRTIFGEQVGATVEPALATSVLVAGLVYPVVCGAVGAVLDRGT